MLNLLKALLTATTAAAVILGAAYIAASISPAYSDKLETLEPPASTFTYVGCVTTYEFEEIFDAQNGRLAATADIQDASVFVVVYPDNSFGLYIFLLGTERVCSLSIGSFEPLITPGRNI